MQGLGEALRGPIQALMILAVGFFVILPLALWKLIDIIWWIASHISINLT